MDKMIAENLKDELEQFGNGVTEVAEDKKKKGPSARIFNIMQYEKHPETKKPLLNEETIRVALLSHASIDRWAYIRHDKDTLEDGTKKSPHWHIVIQMKSATAVKTIAKWFGIEENFVDIPKGRGAGKFLDCVEYLTHESPSQQDLGKYRYDDTEVKASDNFDWRKELNDRALSRLKYGQALNPKQQLRAAIMYEGMTLSEAQEKYRVAYMEDITYLKKLRIEYISKQTPPPLRINYYIQGSSGIGKGLISKAIARSLYPDMKYDSDIYFEVGDTNVAFEGYDGQPVIIWNDKRSYDLFKLLGSRDNIFNVFETHPTGQKQNIKYGSINLCNTVNIVNSVQPWGEFLDGLVGSYTDKAGVEHNAEDKGQSYRRFPLMLVLHENDFDIMFNKGVLSGNRDFGSVVGEYHLRGNLQKIADRCGINKEAYSQIERKVVEPVVQKHNEIKNHYLSREEIPTEDLIAEFADVGQKLSKEEIQEQNRKDQEAIYNNYKTGKWEPINEEKQKMIEEMFGKPENEKK